MPSRSDGLQARLYRNLAPEAWPSNGLSPVNRFVCLAIVASATLTVAATEPAVYNAAPMAIETAQRSFAALFLVEYIARIYAAGQDERYRGLTGRLRYAVTPTAIIDFFAIVPSLLTFVGHHGLLLRLVRLLRILRVARLGRFSLAARELGTALRSRRYELGLSALIALMVLLVAASLMYIVEGSVQPEAFGSIPRALWWSVATLTTVGYGDVYPITPAGRVIAGISAVAAIGIIAIPTGILAAAFSDAFQRRRNR